MKYLDMINSPKDLKKLKISSLEVLSKEIRQFLVNSVSKTGGHLASNLGIVELTVALHYTFDSTSDKFIWDVGHQSYVHKILTGRKNDFENLRTYKGLSGFPKSSESFHDHFDSGHSTTSISAAVGYAVGRDILGEKNNVIAIIGDGAMTGGMAYEAMNNAGRLKTNLIVILNDNQMSISENVGAISKSLSKMRTSNSYTKLKKNIRNKLNNMSMVGNQLESFLEKTRDVLKFAVIDGKFFEELGFKYIGPIDGHDVEELIYVLNGAKNIAGPVLIHVCTKKGKGYKLAEESPSDFHGIGSFDIKTGKTLKNNNLDTYSDVFGKTLCKIATQNNKIIGITAAMCDGTGLNHFAKKFPNKIYDVGIAEQHAVTFSGGLAKKGLIPVFAVYSTFLQRAYDQILHDICIQNLHVVFAIDRAGLVGEDGETHQGIFDISFLSNIPNLTFLAPKNKFEFAKMIKFAIDYDSPIAIRYPRGIASECLKNFDAPIVKGKSELIFQGEEIGIISLGNMMDRTFNVHKKLKEKGFNPTLINARFIKPIDLDMIELLKNYKFVFVVEDNQKIGGFSSQVLVKLFEKGFSGKFHGFGFDDCFVTHGKADLLYKLHFLDEDSIYNKILNMFE